MPKLRYPLRLLLTLPVCVAAFYIGWVNRESQIQSQYEHNREAAEKYRREVFARESRERAARAAQLNDSLDRFEHLQRMRGYERLQRDPAAGRLDHMRSF